MTKVTAIRYIHKLLCERNRSKSVANGACAAHLVIQGVCADRQQAHAIVRIMFR